MSLGFLPRASSFYHTFLFLSPILLLLMFSLSLLPSFFLSVSALSSLCHLLFVKLSPPHCSSSHHRPHFQHLWLAIPNDLFFMIPYLLLAYAFTSHWLVEFGIKPVQATNKALYVTYLHQRKYLKQYLYHLFHPSLSLSVALSLSVTHTNIHRLTQTYTDSHNCVLTANTHKAHTHTSLSPYSGSSLRLSSTPEVWWWLGRYVYTPMANGYHFSPYSLHLTSVDDCSFFP